MSLPDTPVADDDSDVFAEFINWSSGDDHPWIPTNQDDVNLEDYLNPAIRVVAIENPSIVCLSSLTLDSTPCASEVFAIRRLTSGSLPSLKTCNYTDKRGYYLLATKGHRKPNYDILHAARVMDYVSLHLQYSVHQFAK